MVRNFGSEWPIKILAIDDNRIIRHLLKMTFSDKDRFHLIESDSADNGLPIVMAEMPDVIILDIMMPGELNGIQLCKILKSRPDTKNILIIILSARSESDVAAIAIDAGADFYVVKPFSPGELLRMISDIKKSDSKK